MKKILSVKRNNPADQSVFWQSFEIECDEGTSVAEMILNMNSRPLKDIEDKPAAPVLFQCSCQEGKCGACAMLIDGKPGLACDALASDLGEEIVLEPLSKFPLVKDLMVDRDVILDIMRQMNVWLDNADSEAGNESKKDTDMELRMQANRCLHCGCCLEACPNFKIDGSFAGAMGSAAAYATLHASNQDPQAQAEAKAAYKKNFYAGCGKALSCQSVCPMGLPLERMISRNNAAAFARSKKN